MSISLLRISCETNEILFFKEKLLIDDKDNVLIKIFFAEEYLLNVEFNNLRGYFICCKLIPNNNSNKIISNLYIIKQFIFSIYIHVLFRIRNQEYIFNFIELKII